MNDTATNPEGTGVAEQAVAETAVAEPADPNAAIWIAMALREGTTAVNFPLVTVNLEQKK